MNLNGFSIQFNGKEVFYAMLTRDCPRNSQELKEILQELIDSDFDLIIDPEEV